MSEVIDNAKEGFLVLLDAAGVTLVKEGNSSELAFQGLISVTPAETGERQFGERERAAVTIRMLLSDFVANDIEIGNTLVYEEGSFDVNYRITKFEKDLAGRTVTLTANP